VPLSGLLNVHKPSGVTSRHVVDGVQRLVRPAKVGHAGTLDPLASGVLVVCIGQATRLVEYVQQMPKRYEAAFLLGRSSPTEDVEGEVQELVNPPLPSLAEIEQAAQVLLGEIDQRPPDYSALKVGGRRAYALARAGETVELAPRKVTIHRLEIVGYEYPSLELSIECSSGTYVRSLGRDLARRLGTGAVMSALVRTAIGSFRLADAAQPPQITGDTLASLLLPPIAAVPDLVQIVLTAEELQRLANGRSIQRPTVEPATEYAAVDAAGSLVAIVQGRPDGQLAPTRYLGAR